MEESSSSTPYTVTIRRNPPRRGRPTPKQCVSSFPLHDIMSIDVVPPSTTTAATTTTATSNTSISPTDSEDSTSLKVFLRLRPVSVAPTKKPNSKDKDKANLVMVNIKSCVSVNDLNSVTVTPPLCDSSRFKSHVYSGFSHVFSPLSSQDEVYDTMMRPIVDDFLNGTSGLLAALGPSGSGKTHTVFGSTKDPGLVPRAIRHIFQNKSTSSRSFYLSVFEISTEKGKGEKLYDLSPDGGYIHMQQSVVKGLKEILIKDVAHTEAILAGAKLKRATAMTNSNSQSSRSQCIINIRCSIDEVEGKSESSFGGSGLTFVDLAGAEREKKTGNQGGRLLESNFINNTSMVFGLCLRSLLEHQKNPKKSLQKHFQSSLLTRYLRDYLEGRKRMTLILTARSGPEDYFDVSFLLRQASPFMEIKFKNVEETSKLPGNKRRNQTTTYANQKRVKLCSADKKDEAGKNMLLSIKCNGEDISDEANDYPDAKLRRNYCIMQGFAKAMWNVLKEYKERVKAMQDEIDLLTQKISSGQDQYSTIEKELHNLKRSCSCTKELSIDNDCSIGGTNPTPSDRVPVLSAKVQVHATVNCADKPTLDSAREHGPLYPDHKHNKTFKASFLEGDNIETEIPIQVLDQNFEFSALQTPPNGSREIHDHGTTNVRFQDSPTARKSAFVDDNTMFDATFASPFQGAAPLSCDSASAGEQNLQAQCSPMKCENLHDRAKDLTEKDDKVLTDASANFSNLRVMDLKVQRENVGNSADVKMDKVNGANSPESNFNSHMDAKESSRNPLKAERRKRRLMPASSLLLRDVGSLDVIDSDVKHRVVRGGERVAEDEGKRSRGNATLLHLLKNHLPR